MTAQDRLQRLAVAYLQGPRQSAPGSGSLSRLPESDAAITELMQLMPFAGRVGIVLDSADREAVRGRLAWAPELCTGDGVLHGGALMTLADSVGAICAYLNLPSAGRTSTISSSTTFLRAARGGEVTATAQPLHVGRSVIVVQTDLKDERGRLIAQTTQAQAVLAGG